MEFLPRTSLIAIIIYFILILFVNFSLSQNMLKESNPLEIELMGKTQCEEIEGDCSSCAINIVEQIKGLTFNLEEPHLKFRLKSGRAFAKNPEDHVQSIARLSDVDINGKLITRLITTNTLSPEGLSYFEIEGTGPIDGLFNVDNSFNRIFKMPIRDIFKHPGGIQAHGNTAVVALEKPRENIPVDINNSGAAVYILKFTRNPHPLGFKTNLLLLDGHNGEPLDINNNPQPHKGALAAGFVKLNDGHLLLAVVGKSDYAKGIWFYRSIDPSLNINRNTKWKYIDHWEPNCTINGDVNKLNKCYGGANNVGLVTECNGGKIYLIAMNGSDSAENKVVKLLMTTIGFIIQNKELYKVEHEWIQVYRLEKTENGEIDLVFEYSDKDRTGLSQLNNPAFRWGGGVSVIRNNNGLAVYNTERRTRVRSDHFIDGDIYLTEKSATASCSDFNPLLYKENHYRGKKLPIRRDEKNLHNFGWGDKASSFCSSENADTSLYKKKKFQGDSKVTITGMELFPDLKEGGPNNENWNNKISSVQVNFLNSNSPKPLCNIPVFYEHDHYQGKRIASRSAILDLHEEGFGDKISSACVPKGFKITIYKHDNFSGESYEVFGPSEILDLKRDKPDDKNWGDKISSIDIDKI